MARIRTVKPEFWEDESVAALSRDARLLFIACFNYADDEGLIRWTTAYVKASVFMYDDDLTMAKVERLMTELAEGGMVYPYRGGKTQQRLAYVVNFRKHQKINRPQSSKLPPPSLQLLAHVEMYARRDGWTCHLCGQEIVDSTLQSDPMCLSLDHRVPRSKGGSDYPSNISAAHLRCNKQRGTTSLPDALNDPRYLAGNRSLNGSVNGSVSDSSPEGKGREGNREQGGGRARARGAEPPLRCPGHEHNPNPPPCGGCGDARRSHDAWQRAEAAQPTPVASMPDCTRHPGLPAVGCPACAQSATPAPTGWRERSPA